MKLSRELDELLTESSTGFQEYVAEGKARHDATWQSLGWPSSSEMQPQGEAIPILVDEERERDSLDL